MAADALHAARVSMLVPVVPTCDDMNPRGHDRGPIVINAPWGEFPPMLALGKLTAEDT